MRFYYLVISLICDGLKIDSQIIELTLLFETCQFSCHEEQYF